MIENIIYKKKLLALIVMATIEKKKVLVFLHQMNLLNNLDI